MIESPLTNAAQELMISMKSPVEFAKFIADALISVHEQQVTKKDEYAEDQDPHFLLIMFLNDVLPVWFTGGENVAAKVAEGLSKIQEFFGSQGYCRDVSNIISAISYSYRDSDSTVTIDKQLDNIKALLQLGNHFSEIEEQEEAAFAA